MGVVVPSSEGQLMQGGKIRLRLSIRLHFGLDGESEDLQASLGASMGGTGGSRLRRTESLGRTESGATGADPSAAPIMRLAVPLLQVEVSASSACALCDRMARAATRAARAQYLRCEVRRGACYWLLALPRRGLGQYTHQAAHQHVCSKESISMSDPYLPASPVLVSAHSTCVCARAHVAQRLEQ